MSLECCDKSEHDGKHDLAFDDAERVSLCEVLDRVLNKGVVVNGHITISVAEVDLIYLGLELVLTSMETARQSVRGYGNSRQTIDI